MVESGTKYNLVTKWLDNNNKYFQLKDPLVETSDKIYIFREPLPCVPSPAETKNVIKEINETLKPDNGTDLESVQADDVNNWGPVHLKAVGPNPSSLPPEVIRSIWAPEMLQPVKASSILPLSTVRRDILDKEEPNAMPPSIYSSRPYFVQPAHRISPLKWSYSKNKFVAQS